MKFRIYNYTTSAFLESEQTFINASGEVQYKGAILPQGTYEVQWATNKVDKNGQPIFPGDTVKITWEEKASISGQKITSSPLYGEFVWNFQKIVKYTEIGYEVFIAGDDEIERPLSAVFTVIKSEPLQTLKTVNKKEVSKPQKVEEVKVEIKRESFKSQPDRVSGFNLKQLFALDAKAKDENTQPIKNSE